ncbi:TIGR03086 family metal-binding protein [Kitasatospora sp. NPDC048365]|uniref:TIGR03086 family metal-binding protein n=1 Tax=Kitasatospora sp. NPDC048365 TaxID=3364050 RepID=UPI00371769F0
MTTMIGGLIDGALRQAAPVVRGVAEEQLELPTPCSDYTVRELLGHLMQVVVNFQELAEKRPVDWAESRDWLAGDWRERFVREGERLAAAWSEPAAVEGVTGGMGMPADRVGGMVLLDLTVHIWDLAAALGVAFAPDPAAVGHLVPLTTELAPTGREMGMFAEPVPTGPDAPPFERLIALTGRDPGWRRG